MNSKEIMKYLSIGKSTFANKINNIELFSIGKSGNSLIYDREDVEKLRDKMNHVPEGFVYLGGFDGLYAINNVGDIITYHTLFPQKLSPKEDKDGYFEVSLSKNGERHYKRVSRLVAQTFIPNPDNLPVTNHKDENKQNNHVSNLEWCTVQYNTLYSGHKNSGVNNYNSKAVYAYKNDGTFAGYYASGLECGNALGVNEFNVRYSCDNIVESGKYGYYFRREKEHES